MPHEDTEGALAKRIAKLRHKVQRREKKTRAKRRAKSRRIEKRKPKNVREKAKVKAGDVKRAGKQAKQLGGDVKKTLQTEAGVQGSRNQTDIEGKPQKTLVVEQREETDEWVIKNPQAKVLRKFDTKQKAVSAVRERVGNSPKYEQFVVLKSGADFEKGSRQVPSSEIEQRKGLIKEEDEKESAGVVKALSQELGISKSETKEVAKQTNQLLESTGSDAFDFDGDGDPDVLSALDKPLPQEEEPGFGFGEENIGFDATEPYEADMNEPSPGEIEF